MLNEDIAARSATDKLWIYLYMQYVTDSIGNSAEMISNLHRFISLVGLEATNLAQRSIIHYLH